MYPFDFFSPIPSKTNADLPSSMKGKKSRKGKINKQEKKERMKRNRKRKVMEEKRKNPRKDLVGRYNCIRDDQDRDRYRQERKKTD